MRYLPRMQTDGSKDAPGSDARAGADLRTLRLWHLQPVRDLLVIAAVAGTVYVGYAMRTVTVPLLVALALAYLFEPIVSRMSRWRRMNRPLAVSMILSALIVFVGGAIAVIVPLAVGQTLAFGESLRSGRYDTAIDRAVEVVPDAYRDAVRDWTYRVIHPMPQERGAEQQPGGATGGATGTELAAPGETSTAKPPQERAAKAESTSMFGGFGIDHSIVTLLGAGSAQVWSFALAVLQLGLVAFLIPFYFYYFSVHWPAIVGFFAMFVPDDRREGVFEIARDMDRAVAGFVRGRIVICSIMGVMFAIGWQICGVPYGIALGLMTGAFSIVPYLGGIGLPFAVGLLVVDQFGLDEGARMAVWGMLLWPTVVFIVVQSVEGYVLTPIIAGKATNLDPVTIVVAILAGGSVAGVYGMLLAIPLAACGKIAAKRLLLPRITEWARGRAPDPLPLGKD
jgi:predicted PurR-regulated permease PerM